MSLPTDYKLAGIIELVAGSTEHAGVIGIVVDAVGIDGFAAILSLGEAQLAVQGHTLSDGAIIAIEVVAGLACQALSAGCLQIGTVSHVVHAGISQ